MQHCSLQYKADVTGLQCQIVIVVCSTEGNCTLCSKLIYLQLIKLLLDVMLYSSESLRGLLGVSSCRVAAGLAVIVSREGRCLMVFR